MSKKKKIIIIIAAIVIIAIIGMVIINVLKCDYPGCDNFQESGSKFCNKHTCKQEGCYNEKYSRDNYCTKHKYEVEYETFDAVTGAKLLNVDDSSFDTVILVFYTYEGGKTRGDSLEIIKKYVNYINTETNWELKSGDENNPDAMAYDIGYDSVYITLDEDNTIQVFVTG